MWSALGNGPINDTARWVPEPIYRGSYSILSSCIVTLSLCVWTALHLNVPERQHKKRIFWWKALWLVSGLLAPEIVALAAYRQRAEQSELTADMERALGCNPTKPKNPWHQRFLVFLYLRNRDEHNLTDKANPEGRPEANAKARPRQRHNSWTSTHSYLAIMGGFVFDNTADPSQCPLPENRNSVTITGKGLVLLAELAPDLVPDISIEAIRDNSKTNGLAKLIACVQSIWFCLQVATRLAQHLPVTYSR